MTLVLPRERWSNLSPNVQGSWLPLSCGWLFGHGDVREVRGARDQSVRDHLLPLLLGLLVLAPAMPGMVSARPAY
ncbi:MAG: hypothetical protein R3D05_08955 [Dongiaceae bacterium]